MSKVFEPTSSLKAIFVKLGFVPDHAGTYARGFRRHGTVVYVKTTKRLSLVLDPDKHIVGEIIVGFVLNKAYFSRSLSCFPKKENKGDLENFGIDCIFNTESEVEAFLGGLA